MYAHVRVHTYSPIPANVAVGLDNLWELISIDDESSIVTDSSSIREFSMLRERRPSRLHPSAYVSHAFS